MSTLTIVELLGFKNITPIENTAIHHILQTALIVDVDSTIAQQAAQFRRRYNLGTVDSVIAATAMALSAQLITNDKKIHSVSEIKIVSL